MDVEQAAITSKRASITITFDGSAGTGAQGAVPIFTVTGDVLVKYITAVVTVDLKEDAGNPTLSLGVTSGVADFIAATTATALDAGEIWVDTGPDANSVAVPDLMKDIIVVDNIIGTVAGTNLIDAGAIRFDVYYLPLSSDGLVA